MRNRAAFLDRDGVINRKPPEGEYVTRWEEMHFLPGVAKAIAQLNRAGFQVVVVSNQRCVAKGLLTENELASLHQRMRTVLAEASAKIDAVYHCPHDTDPPCGCRKPRPGMLLDAARMHDIELNASWMIGDSETDVQAGRNAGCKTARLLSIDETASQEADIAATSLLDAVRQILQREETLCQPPGESSQA
jgi:D-glycero-D-manno-heptose 1,7-bisphosphate phosphatase